MTGFFNPSFLSVRQLFAVAIHTEEFNIQFFHSWANRMRAFDWEVMELLNNMSKDAREYHRTLSQVSQRLFDGELIGLDKATDIGIQQYIGQHIDLPKNRYFVVNDKEVRDVLSVALSLQRNTIALLTLIDKALWHKYKIQLLAPEERIDSEKQFLSDQSV